MDRSQLVRLIASGGVRPMAYKRQPESRWWWMFAITLIFLAIAIGLNLAGIIN